MEDLTGASHIAHMGMASITRVTIAHTGDLMTAISNDIAEDYLAVRSQPVPLHLLILISPPSTSISQVSHFKALLPISS